MHAFGHYILSGRMQAIGVISFLSTFSLLIPPLAFLVSGVPIGLVSLRKGAQPVVQVIIGSAVLMALIALILNIQPILSLIILCTVWLPVCLCALVLRQTQNPAMMALAAASIALLLILFMYINIGDVEDWWRSLLQEMLVSGYPDKAMSIQYQQALELAPPLMNAVVASSIVISLIITVLIARWWQSSLFNPKGFGSEFRSFNLPRQMVLPSIIAMGLLFLNDLPFAALLRDLVVVLVVLYLFQGLASVHRTVNKRSLSRNWLFGMYALLVFLPQVMVIFIAWMGMTDSLLGGRPVLPGKGG